MSSSVLIIILILIAHNRDYVHTKYVSLHLLFEISQANCIPDLQVDK